MSYVIRPTKVKAKLFTAYEFEHPDTLDGRLEFSFTSDDEDSQYFVSGGWVTQNRQHYATIVASGFQVYEGDYLIEFENGSLGKCLACHFEQFYAPEVDCVKIKSGYGWTEQGEYIDDLEGYICVKSV